MKKILKWAGVVLGSLLGLILLATAGLYAKASMEMNKTYDVQAQSIPIPTDAESLERGKYLADVLCAECHDYDMGGKPGWMNIPGIAVISAPNLTSGSGSVVVDFSDEDWVRALRHGVKTDGKSVFIMPSSDFYYMSDGDLGSLLAYLKSSPPVNRGEGEEILQFTLLGQAAYGAGAFGNLLEASKVDHSSRPASFPEPGVTVGYGEYLVNIHSCRICHGVDLAGGDPSDPESTLAPNLTPGGDLADWTDADFIEALRTGIVPSGRRLVPKFMPWTYKGKMTDDELKAIFMYLQSLPALETSTAPVK